MAIQYIHIKDCLSKLGLVNPDFFVCSDNHKDFSLMRVQLNAKLKFDAQKGPCVADEFHEQKCLKIIQMETKKSSDLLVFPEYSISYELLDSIMNDDKLWPQQDKLWCLPCQGILYEEFLSIMKRYENNGIIVISDAYSTVNKKNFINAQMYLFTTTTPSGERHVVLVPQLKTCPMRDISYDCEEYMSLGNTIFVFGDKNGIGLVSLLCADSLNQEIMWQDLCRQCCSLILLHPQLNNNCKNSTFRRIRSEMFSQSNKHIYISCNWAQGTIIADDRLSRLITINSPWSCIYYKYDPSYSIKQWYDKNLNRLKLNANLLLYGGFLSHEKVAVWYSYPEELFHNIIIQKPFHRQAGILVSEENVIVTTGYIWGGKEWIDLPNDHEHIYRTTHYSKYFNSEYQEAFQKIIEQPRYNYPFVCDNKVDADRFFELALACDELANSCISSEEKLMSPTLIIDSDSLKEAERALQNFLSLIELLKTGRLPKHLDHYNKDHHFEVQKDGLVYSNLTTADKKNRIIVAIAPDKTKAMQYIEDIKSKSLIKYSKDNDDEFPYKICVYAKRLGTDGYDCLPEFNTTIITPERVQNQVDITRGGFDNV